MDTVQLLWGQLVHLQQGLEIIPGERNDSLSIKWQFYLGCEINIRNYNEDMYCTLATDEDMHFIFQGA